MVRKLHKIRRTIPICKYGCGQPVKRGVAGKFNNYLHGHNGRNQSSNSGQFKKGNKCGKGRAEGSRNKVTIAAMNIIKGEEEALSRRAIESTLNGSTQLLQFCLVRLIPPPPKDSIVKLEGMPTCDNIQSSVASFFVCIKEVS